MTTTKPSLFKPVPRAHDTAPAISPPVWPGRKAAVAAALAGAASALGRGAQGAMAVGTVTDSQVTVKDLRPIPVCGSSIRPLAAQRRLAEGQRSTTGEG